MGAEEFAKTGVPSSPGTAIFSVSGNVARPGNYELPLGTPMRELIYEHAGGCADGRELKCVIPGGSSVPALTPDQIDVPLDYDSLGAIGTFFGAASLIVVDDRCCMVQLALRSTKFYMHESCGKCTPCRVGTRWMVQILESIEAGTATRADLDLLENVGDNILGKVLCALGEFAVYPVDSYLKKWRSEFEAHVDGGGCPFHGESSLEGILAPSDMHDHTPVAQEALV
jgi:NADH-quinone oxidoreductase subunit F